MQLLPSLIVALLGLTIGSFLGALTYRKPRRISVINGRSFCPHCKAKIVWYDNIPLLSFFCLGGRCRTCGKKISFRYVAIETLTAVIFLALFRYFGFPLFFYLATIAFFLIAIFIIDLEHKIIPDELVFWGILIVFAFLLFFSPNLLFKNLLVGFVASFSFLLIHLVTRGRGMGLGDVKFVVLGGLILGWPETPVWLFLAFASGAVIGVILILLRKTKFGREIAFGPFLAGSLLLTIFWGEKILSWYLNYLS